MSRQELADACNRAIAERCTDVRRKPRWAGIDASHIGSLERGEIRWPNDEYRAGLCAVFGTTESALGLYIRRPPRRRAFIDHTDTAAAGERARTVLSDVEDLRLALDDTLVPDDGDMSDRIEYLDMAVFTHAEQCLLQPPPVMLARISRDLAEARRHLAGQRPTVQQRLFYIAARLATLVADEFMVLGEIRRSSAWHVTARRAADECGDRELQADVRAMAALLPLYFGDAADAVRLARDAQAREPRTGLATALAPTYEAVALAQLGAAGESERALETARRNLAGLGVAHSADSVVGLSPRRWRFCEGKVLSYLGRTEEAWAIHDEALTLYPADVVGDPAMIRFDRAISLVRGGQVSTGCVLAERTLTELPAEHRTELFVDAAHRVARAVPAQHERCAAVHQLRSAIRSLAATW